MQSARTVSTETQAAPDPARVISNVVMMGMGEPLLNYDQVLGALRLMLDDNAYGLSRRRVTVSTSGVVPMMKRLGRDRSGARRVGKGWVMSGRSGWSP